ncbi:MAG: preprotein translocase subunit SecG [Oscillospiraceae bacterium]|nr:preprotein translocase subunit SecG [Oscillospiraceae bacterium]
MSILEIITGALLVVCSVAIIMLVLAQQPKGGMGTLGGGDMFADMSSRSTDAKIANVTKYAGCAFFALALVVSAISLMAK